MLTTDGKTKPYLHGKSDKMNTSITVESIRKINQRIISKDKNSLTQNYIVLNEEEIEKLIEEEMKYEKIYELFERWHYILKTANNS